jgi:hypothetical protein
MRFVALAVNKKGGPIYQAAPFWREAQAQAAAFLVEQPRPIRKKQSSSSVSYFTEGTLVPS